jgi:hypothetical protein
MSTNTKKTKKTRPICLPIQKRQRKPDRYVYQYKKDKENQRSGFLCLFAVTFTSNNTAQWSLIPGRISMPEMMSGLVVSVKSNILSFLVGWNLKLTKANHYILGPSTEHFQMMTQMLSTNCIIISCWLVC